MTGDLVQVYRNDLDYTFRSVKKLLPKWGVPRRVVAREVNSYKLATLGGLVLKGLFHARRLRRFTPREGTALSELIAAGEVVRLSAGLDKEEAEDVVEEGDLEEEDEQRDEGRIIEDESDLSDLTDEEEELAEEPESVAVDESAKGWLSRGRLRSRKA